MYLPKVDEYEKLIDTDQADRANLLYNPMMIRGQLYQAMAFFQEDGIKKAELSKQSLKFFINLLQEDFTEHKTQQYAQNDNQHMLYLYDFIITKISENYNSLIAVKFDYIVNLPLGSRKSRSPLKELNILRRDFAVQLMAFEKFADENPGLYSNDRMMSLNYEINFQLRSLILFNQKNQLINVHRSNAYLLLQSTFARLC